MRSKCASGRSKAGSRGRDDLRSSDPDPAQLRRSSHQAFYLDFLGFDLTFEHRFEAALPLYIGVARGGCELHLSEHHGDATPGSAVRIPVDDVDAFVAALPRDYGNARPGEPEATSWQTREITILDPSGNRLTFYTDMTHGAHD